MMRSLALLLMLCAPLAFAAGVKKEVCHVEKDKAGKEKKVCKVVIVHQKLDGTKVPDQK